jgi:hypothetical protein
MGTTRRPGSAEGFVRRFVAVLVELLGPGIAGVVLLVVSLVVAGLVFIPTVILLIAIESVLHPSDTVAAALGIGWFVGSLVALFVVLVRLRRWLNVMAEAPDRVASALDPSLVSAPLSQEERAQRARDDAERAARFTSRLASADAGLAPHETDPSSQAPKGRQ